MTSDPHALQARGVAPGVDCAAFCRVLHEDAGRLPYQRRKDEEKTTVHWGQRKLLMSEIEFLTQIAGDMAKAETSAVVYAGAAPGTHIRCLSRLFPDVQFVLVDPAPFTVRPGPKIRILQRMFDDELARELSAAADSVFFVSDVRTADPERDGAEGSEVKIKADMEAQRRWHALLGSKRSMLKFRLPWDKSTSEYLDGDVYLPVWGPQTTTECRLVTRRDNPSGTRVYDHEKYESQMFYFNTVTRCSLYSHGVAAEGLDRCYDCRAEVHILREYVALAEGLAGDGAERDARVAELSAGISRQISRARTLADANPDKAQRVAAIRRNQYIDGAPAYEARKRSKFCS